VITGSGTALREYRASDLEVLTELRNDLEVQRLLLARPRPNTGERVAEWVAGLGSDSHAALFVVTTLDDAPIGFVQITSIDTVSGHCRLGIAVRADHQRHGHGREAIELVAGYLRDTFGIRKIVLEVMAENERAVDLYRAIGFREVGVLREHFAHGDTRSDVVIMEWFLEP